MSKLEKGRDVLADEVTSQKGVSDVGIDVRRADQRNPGVMSHGYARVSDPAFHKEKAKTHLKSLVNAIKVSKKPDLPKSEMEKASQEKGVHMPRGETPKRRGTSKMQIMDETQAKKEATRVLGEQRSMPKPKLTKADIEQFDETLRKDSAKIKLKAIRDAKMAERNKQLETHFGAKGKAVPEHLKTPQAETLDYKQMGAEFRAKHNTRMPLKPNPRLSPKPESNTPNPKLFDPDRSGTVNYKKPMGKAEAKIIPGEVSEPMIQNKPIVESAPHKISPPVQVTKDGQAEKMKKCGHALKRMANSLRKVDPKTHLPGILLDKSQENSQGKAEAAIKIPEKQTHAANWEKAKKMNLVKPNEKPSDYTFNALKSKIQGK